MFLTLLANFLYFFFTITPSEMYHLTETMPVSKKSIRALSIQPKIPEISVGKSNGTDHFGLVRPEYSGPGALSIQQKFRFEIPEIFRVQWNGTFRFHRPDPSHRAFDSHQIQT